MTNWITVPNNRPAGPKALSTPRATINFKNATISFNKKASEQLVGPLGRNVVLMIDPSTATIGIRRAYDYEPEEIKRKVYGHHTGGKATAISIHAALRALGMQTRTGSERVEPVMSDGMVTVSLVAAAKPVEKPVAVKPSTPKLRRIAIAA